MLDYLGIFREFNARKIEYIVVGGLAVNLHGIPRMSYDIDIILYLGDSNIERFLLLMKEWRFKPRVPVDIMDFADAGKRSDWMKNKNMRAFNLVNPGWGISEIDVIIDTPINYKDAFRNIAYIKLKDIVIPTISIDDLITMKKASNRQQDKKDIIYLKKVKSGNKKLRV